MVIPIIKEIWMDWKKGGIETELALEYMKRNIKNRSILRKVLRFNDSKEAIEYIKNECHNTNEIGGNP